MTPHEREEAKANLRKALLLFEGQTPSKETQAAASSKESWISENMFMFLAPVAAYAAYFAYKYGYYRQFSIPYYLISVDPEELIVGACILLFLLKKRILSLAFSKAASGFSKLLYAIMTIALPTFFLGDNAYHYTNNPSVVIVIVTASILASFVVYVDRYEKRRLAKYPKDTHGKMPDITTAQIRALWKGIALPNMFLGVSDFNYWDKEKFNWRLQEQQTFAIQCILYLLVYLVGVGMETARSQTVFNVLEKDPSCVVVDVNDGRILCMVLANPNAPKGTHELSPMIRVFSLEEKTEKPVLFGLGGKVTGISVDESEADKPLYTLVRKELGKLGTSQLLPEQNDY